MADIVVTHIPTGQIAIVPEEALTQTDELEKLDGDLGEVANLMLTVGVPQFRLPDNQAIADLFGDCDTLTSFCVAQMRAISSIVQNPQVIDEFALLQLDVDVESFLSVINENLIALRDRIKNNYRANQLPEMKVPEHTTIDKVQQFLKHLQSQ
ncbi:hypothetical protein [Ralstonia phage RP13]|nr:hypothetical protein [Ralstonia phage RP13]